MKKVLLTAVAVFSLTFVNAQEENATSAYKPVKGTIATEVGLTGGLNNANFNLNSQAVKFRYFFKDDMALRLGLGLNSNKTEAIDNSTPSNVITETYKNSSTLLNIGIEKHFAGSERLSTYAGADLLIGFRGASYDFKNNTSTVNVDGANTLGNTAGSSFGLRVVTGADYYITKKVFLGVEAGLNFLAGKDKDITTTVNPGTSTTSTGGKTNGLATSIVGGVRIGFQF